MCNFYVSYFNKQEVKTLREETANEENSYHFINSMTAVSMFKVGLKRINSYLSLFHKQKWQPYSRGAAARWQ